MTVYVVTATFYDTTDVERVFTSRERAEAYCEEQNRIRNFYFEFEEFTLE